MPRKPGGGWTFFTNHAHVLFCLALDPDLRIRDIADKVGITERATQRIIHELEESGYLRIKREGRRNHYRLVTNKRLRHPIESERSVKDLITFLDG